MASTSHGGRDAETWRLVRRQHGVVTRRQLAALGFSRAAIEHRLRIGRLHRAGRGVYAVGRPALNREGRWMAAVLACGPGASVGQAGDAARGDPGAVLSHRSAAALWGIGIEAGGRIDVSVGRECRLRRPGIRIRSRPSLHATDVTERLRIPVTAIVRTFLDIATELPPNRLERAVNEADKRDLIDPDALRGALDRRVGEPGVRALRAVLDPHTFRLSDDELELLFRPLAASAGLPVQLAKVWVNGFEVDFFWPDLGLVVETDGWRYHRTPSSQTRAASRDQAHTASGLSSLRFSHWQVKHEPAYVRRILQRTAAHLERGRPSPPDK